ncbi:MAG TPA: hypothetical protein PK252_11520 [Bacteroidales bacterium]|nr:hypothetical protein [Bacteroidales bacterium]
MGLDIKYPIGLMFTILGIMITIYGFATINDTTLYQKSLGININLWSGISMLVFGIVMLVLSKKNKKEE